MAVPQIIEQPEYEGIFRYYTHAHAPWGYFQPGTNPAAPIAVVVAATGEWAVNVSGEMRSAGADLVSTGRFMLGVWHVGDDDDDAPGHELDGTLYGDEESAHRAAFEAGLTAFRVAD